MNEELKIKLGELLVSLVPQIERDFNELEPKDRIKLWMSLAAMYLHESALDFMDFDDDEGGNEEAITNSKEYN